MLNNFVKKTKSKYEEDSFMNLSKIKTVQGISIKSSSDDSDFSGLSKIQRD